MSSEPFNFVIGRILEDGRISCYSYGGEIQFGTLKQARGLLEYVKQTSWTTEKFPGWKIYRLNPEEVK